MWLHYSYQLTLLQTLNVSHLLNVYFVTYA